MQEYQLKYPDSLHDTYSVPQLPLLYEFGSDTHSCQTFGLNSSANFGYTSVPSAAHFL